jgi:hypothetical protein
MITSNASGIKHHIPYFAVIKHPPKLSTPTFNIITKNKHPQSSIDIFISHDKLFECTLLDQFISYVISFLLSILTANHTVIKFKISCCFVSLVLLSINNNFFFLMNRMRNMFNFCNTFMSGSLFTLSGLMC